VSGGLGQAKLDAFAQEMPQAASRWANGSQCVKFGSRGASSCAAPSGEQVDHRFIGWLTGQPIEQV
jgi:nicotinic acid phosphoribosyltransferase